MTRVRVTLLLASNRPQPFATVHKRPPAAVVGAKLPCLWEKLQKRDFFNVSELRGGRGTSWDCNMFQDVSKIVLCTRRNTFATFSENGLRFWWQTQHFEHLRCHFAWQAQHFERVVLCAFANRIVSAARSGDKVQIPWQAWHS